STTAAIWIKRGYDRAEQQRQLAEKHSRTADEHFRTTLRTAAQLTSALDQLLDDVPTVEEQQQEQLKRLQPLLTQVLQEKPTDPEMREELALALHRVGKLRGKILLVDEAESFAREAFARAVAEFEELAGEFPEEARYQFHLARCLNDFAEFLRA